MHQLKRFIRIKMAEINSVVADPISSDGSEESWILLEEMDEAMREEFSTSRVSEVDQGNPVTGSTSTDTMTQSSVIEMAREPVPEICVTEDIIDDPPNIETIGSEVCPSNDEDDDDINDSPNLRRYEMNKILDSFKFTHIITIHQMLLFLLSIVIRPIAQ